MPRYHFNVEDGQSIPDPEGTVLPDLESARREAVRLAGRLLDDDPAHFWSSGAWRVVVTDDAGRTLFILDFRAREGAELSAVEPRG
ncbi:DUF6894 family protein [Phenylobacterium sp.]|uniref:DUF6894 family protein n=1 Tax=Phenylobacterium sp. TaxID=1871053 RepID=UPI002C342287|nr:hypothetical protein [Phenylobacterium sp.]HVI30841.1 hypothetical protein [Phenylobacterium sp.]